MNRLVFILFCLVCCSNWSCIHDEEPFYMETLEVGDRLPQFSVQLNDGKIVDDTQFKDKVGMLVFFRTSCPDCREELPVVQQLYDIYKDDARVCIYCIDWREDAGTVSQYWQAEGLTLPYAVECSEDIYEKFATNVIPAVFVSDRMQVIRYKFGDNPIASFEELVHAVESCLSVKQ